MNPNIFIGLTTLQKAVLLSHLRKRLQLKQIERAELDAAAPPKEAQRSKIFAFWVVLGRLAQDRPIYLSGGLLLLALSFFHAIFKGVGSCFRDCSRPAQAGRAD